MDGRAEASGGLPVGRGRTAAGRGGPLAAPGSAARDAWGGESGPDRVRPLERGLAVLRALSGAGAPMRAGDLVRATGLARSTVDRVVATLLRLGLLRQHGQELSTTPRLMALGNAYLAASGLTGEAVARTGRLADELDESVSLAVPDGDGVRFVAQAVRRRTMSVAFRIGDLLPAERCAPGSLFAAEWDTAGWAAWRAGRAADPEGTAFPAVPPLAVHEARFAARAARAADAGWALDEELIEPGLIAVSVPVPDGHGRTRCALSVVSHTSRHTAADLADLVLPRLRAEAARLAEAFAAPEPAPPAAGTHRAPRTLRPAVAPPATVAPPASHAPAPGDGPAPGCAPAPAPPSPAALARAAKEELGPGFLQSLARGLAVLEALEGARGPGLPLAALAAATGLPRATARRCLHTLAREGYAACDGRLHRPLPRVLELGYARLSRLSFAELAQPHLRDLAERVGEPASVAVLDGPDVLHVASAPGVRIMSPHITPGTRFPAYPTATGRVLLAGLPEAERLRVLAAVPPGPLTRRTVTAPRRLAQLVAQVAREGHASVDEELEEGLRAVAVPIRDAAGRVVAALNVSRHTGGTPLAAARDALLPALRTAAAAIETDLHTAERFNPVPVR
ncbi:IclR family transcriptional regulator domain-containing protein [Streptomyces sulfonofaciens]|uniref:IclR family transcriptional regulator domain-containing protein n=1 Tax=Streptomyces sulfonofaciens TaxID=68272 RepID=UPI003570BA7E